MPIDIKCSSCSTPYRVPDEMAGRAAKCKKCGVRIEIPATATDGDELNIEDPFVASASDPSSDGAANQTADAAGDAVEQQCPMCGAELLPDSDLCMVCGYTLSSGDESADEEAFLTDDEKEERRVTELLKKPERTLAQKIGDWSVRVLAVLATLGVVAWGGLAIKQSMDRSQSHGRIDGLITSGLKLKSSEEVPALAKTLADEIEHLPSFIDVLMEANQRVTEVNQNIGGLKAVEETIPRYLLVFKGQDYDVTHANAEDIPISWRQRTVLATLMINFPDNSDVKSLIQVEDLMKFPELKKVVGDRTEKEWQIEKSCDTDENVRNFAASLLLDRLNATGNKEALAALAKATSVEEKQALFSKWEANPP